MSNFQQITCKIITFLQIMEYLCGMSKFKKYIFNPDTLSYELTERSTRRFLKSMLLLQGVSQRPSFMYGYILPYSGTTCLRR